MKHIRLLITEKCNAKCPNCFNSSYRKSKEMTLQEIEKLSLYFSSNGVSTVFVEGGEPTIHSSFNKAMTILQDRFERVVLFSNAMSEAIHSFNPRSNDSIVYNFNFISDSFDTERFLQNRPGKRSVMIQIAVGTNIQQLINRIHVFDSLFEKDRLSLLLTLDCTVDIFKNAKILANKWNQFLAACIINKWNVKIDHGFPLCIKEQYQCMMIEVYQGKVSDVSNKKGLYWCDHNRAGLVDAHFNLRYCNNYYSDLVLIMNGDEFLSIDSIEHFLIEAQAHKDSKLPARCINCSSFLNGSCNATCFGCRQF